jgi:hypothetical protein
MAGEEGNRRRQFDTACTCNELSVALTTPASYSAWSSETAGSLGGFNSPLSNGGRGAAVRLEGDFFSIGMCGVNEGAMGLDPGGDVYASSGSADHGVAGN